MVTASFDVQASLEATGRQNAEGATKVHEDLDRYRTVIESTRPDVIVECGTYRGGSARWFRSLGPDVITVDIFTSEFAAEGVAFVVGDSADPATVQTVTSHVAGRRTMVVLDSDHSAGHVAAEIAAYGPLVTPGCYLVVEDGIVRWMTDQPYRGSPLDAIEDLLVDSPDWERDTEVEAMFPVSMYPAGWWRRIVSED
jgi:cephalosporin hydroxylase